MHAPTPQALVAVSICLLNPKPLRKANDLSTTVTTLASNQQRVGKLHVWKLVFTLLWIPTTPISSTFYSVEFLRMLSTDKSATEGMMNTQILCWCGWRTFHNRNKAKTNLTTCDQQIWLELWSEYQIDMLVHYWDWSQAD